ncbi:MAG: aminotransferase class I/II-fold pyridoxal phosphate-dependent enzyme [Acidimicrobiia bacterium]
MPRIYLSPPDLGAEERALLLDAFDSNWVAPVGPHLDAFEREMARAVGVPHAVALSSGTAALHLAFVLLGVGPGDDVLASTLTFAATANAVAYVGARPVFVDSDERTWTMDPTLLAEELRDRAQRGRLPKAVVAVDLYGQCADYTPIRDACAEYGVPIVEDAAEALGATYGDRPAGSLGDLGVLSFNGNKIITTSGGGMLLTTRREWAERARYLATQAREPVRHYEHLEVGYNYRLSNLLAALGRGQLARLDQLVARRRAVNARYRALLGDLPGFAFMPDAPYGRSNGWLTCLRIDPLRAGTSTGAVQAHLERHDVESRPTWKPMHLQPAFADCARRGGAVAEAIFAEGLCLPSGSGLTDDDVRFVAGLVRDVACSEVTGLDGGFTDRPVQEVGR